MNKITLQELFASAKPKLIAEEISWEGNVATIWFQRLTMDQSADIGRPFLNADGTALDKDKIKLYQAELIAQVVRDEEGNRVVEASDVLGWDAAFYQAVRTASEKHNPAASAAGVEDVAKKSETTPSTEAS